MIDIIMIYHDLSRNRTEGYGLERYNKNHFLSRSYPFPSWTVMTAKCYIVILNTYWMGVNFAFTPTLKIQNLQYDKRIKRQQILSMYL